MTDPVTSFIPAAIFLLLAAGGVIAAVKVFGRVGWPPWLGLLVIIPFVNVVLFLVLGFKEWPIERALREARERVGIRLS